MPTITDALVRRLVSSASAVREEIADDKVAGFRVRVSSQGAAFFLRYRSASGQQRNPKLGDYPRCPSPPHVHSPSTGALSSARARTQANTVSGGEEQRRSPTSRHAS